MEWIIEPGDGAKPLSAETVKRAKDTDLVYCPECDHIIWSKLGRIDPYFTRGNIEWMHRNGTGHKLVRMRLTGLAA